MKYKIGDKVKVIKNLHKLDIDKYDIVPEMYKYADCVYTISDILYENEGISYIFKEDPEKWFWDEDLIEKYEDLAEVKLNCISQDNEMLKQALRQAKHEYDALEKYYQFKRDDYEDLQQDLRDLADQNVELFRKNNDLTNKLVESGKKIAELQGKLDKLTNILNTLTGREDW